MKYKIPLLFIATLLLAACSTSAVQPAPTLDAVQQQGQSVFNLRCAQCHATVPDTVVIGPSMYGLATRAATRMEGYDAQAYIEHSILFPKDYIVDGFTDTMPTNFGKELTSDELNAIISYLMTFK
ncbi:MAG: cytochrome c [Anaerolineales bacterium]|nr:cytochrome c [Anaerolineales bacterium]